MKTRRRAIGLQNRINRKKNIDEYNIKFHKHTVICLRNSLLRNILIKDDLEKFKEFYKDDIENIKSEFIFRCNIHANKKKCKYLTILSGVLNHNSGEICKYIIKKEKCNAYDFL